MISMDSMATQYEKKGAGEDYGLSGNVYPYVYLKYEYKNRKKIRLCMLDQQFLYKMTHSQQWQVRGQVSNSEIPLLYRLVQDKRWLSLLFELMLEIDKTYFYESEFILLSK